MVRSRRLAMGGLAVVVGLGAVVSGFGAGVAGASTFTVTNTNASGAGSLTQAITAANAHAGADTITFAASTNGHAIAAPGESPVGDLTIQGNGIGVTIISGEINTNNSNGTLTVTELSVGDINASTGGRATTSVVLTNLLVAPDGIDINSGGTGAKTTATIANVKVVGNEIDVNSDESSVTQATITDTIIDQSNNDGLNVNGPGTSVSVAGTTISNSDDGGIDANDATLRVVNSTIAASKGDGVDLGGNITLQNVTVSGAQNTLMDAFSGSISMTNTILFGPTEEGVCDDSGATIVSHGGNIANDDSCHLTNAADHPSTDAHLGALAANGGSTKTIMPGAGSAAIDGGVAAGCPATDQRGAARPQDGNGDGTAVCDSGAVEAAGKVSATTTTTTVATSTTTATVSGATTPTTAAAVSAAAELPRTGSSSIPLGLGGVVLVVFGAALGLGARRRAV